MQVAPESSAHFLRYRLVVSWTGDLIRRRRDALGLTQAQLADRVGASLRAVSSWESDDSQPQKKFRVELEKVLGPPQAPGSDPSRPVDLSTLSNSQIVVLMAQLAAEVGIRMDETTGETRTTTRDRAQRSEDTPNVRDTRYYPIDDALLAAGYRPHTGERPDIRKHLGPYSPDEEDDENGARENG